MARTESDDLRRAIVRAAIPLMGDFPTVTTKQIAEATGVTEAEFRTVFADKDAVMHAYAAMVTDAVSAAINPTAAVRDIAAIDPDQVLAVRLARAVDVLDAYHQRSRVDIDAIMAGAMSRPEEIYTLGSSLPEIRQAIATLLEPDEQHLRLPARTLAAAFVAMTFDGIRPDSPNQPPLPADQIVDLFLHGALNAD